MSYKIWLWTEFVNKSDCGCGLDQFSSNCVLRWSNGSLLSSHNSEIIIHSCTEAFRLTLVDFWRAWEDLRCSQGQIFNKKELMMCSSYVPRIIFSMILIEVICAEVNFSWDKLNESDKISKQYSSHKESCCYLNCNVLLTSSKRFLCKSRCQVKDNIKTTFQSDIKWKKKKKPYIVGKVILYATLCVNQMVIRIASESGSFFSIKHNNNLELAV